MTHHVRKGSKFGVLPFHSGPTTPRRKLTRPGNGQSLAALSVWGLLPKDFLIRPAGHFRSLNGCSAINLGRDRRQMFFRLCDDMELGDDSVTKRMLDKGRTK
jgi:hypothetical protein